MDEILKIIVIGERELVTGYRLIGVNEWFEMNDEEAARKIISFLDRRDVGIIIASESIRQYLSQNERDRVDLTTRPLVVFVPSPKFKGERREEAIRDLAKRILGIDVGV